MFVLCSAIYLFFFLLPLCIAILFFYGKVVGKLCIIYCKHSNISPLSSLFSSIQFNVMKYIKDMNMTYINTLTHLYIRGVN